MHFPSLGPLIVVLLIVLVLFGGRGKISQVMGDFAKGIKSFKKGLSDEEEQADDTVKTIDAEADAVSAKTGRSAHTKKATVSRTAKSKS